MIGSTTSCREKQHHAGKNNIMQGKTTPCRENNTMQGKQHHAWKTTNSQPASNNMHQNSTNTCIVRTNTTHLFIKGTHTTTTHILHGSQSSSFYAIIIIICIIYTIISYHHFTSSSSSCTMVRHTHICTHMHTRINKIKGATARFLVPKMAV